MAATGDRVPTVFVEDGSVVGLDPKDPIEVSYKQAYPGDPDLTTDAERAKLKMDWSHGHNATIHNGISRIGFYTGGHAARFRDEDLGDKWIEKSNAWLEAQLRSGDDVCANWLWAHDRWKHGEAPFRKLGE